MKFRIAVVAAMVVGVLVAAGTAAASCDPNGSNINGNWFDGWATPPPLSTCLDGSVANILVYSPYVQYAEVTGWTMLYNNSSGSYGQVGWTQFSTGYRYNFTESQTSNGGFQLNYFGSSSIGDDPEYKITFSSNAFHYFINGTNIQTDSNTGYTGCYGEQEGEVLNLADQMPGGYNAHAYFISAQVRRADTEAWINFNGTTNSDTHPPYRTDSFLSSKVSATEFDIWDSACST
jgi:hypothetical protein